MKVYSTILRCKALAIVVSVSLFVFPATVFSQEFTTPEALLDAWTKLITRDCDLECSRRLASMYSQQILQLNKDALVRTLRYSPDRTNDALILFGKDIGQKELVQMSPTDVFAHQLLYRDQSIDDAYRYAQAEVLSSKYISPNEVEVVLRRSGLPAAPKMTELETIRLVKEGGEWKIGY
ncbi:MAG: hypothetical protein QNJ04_07595 [Desulfobacterales bacterium]|nr:hypothetical protein [Desulfobacterales bacterium]